MKTHWENQDKDSKVKMDFQSNPTFITEIILTLIWLNPRLVFLQLKLFSRWNIVAPTLFGVDANTEKFNVMDPRRIWMNWILKVV